MAEPAEGVERAIEREARSEIETQIERRRSPRSPLLVRVSYSTVDALFSEFTRNINEGGLFIETESPPPPGTRVSLQFQLPGGSDPIHARGRVTWVTPASASTPAGMGVEFEHLGPEARVRIDEIVRRLRSGRAS
jgi:uncharacterized protein (TIGR02266 family)